MRYLLIAAICLLLTACDNKSPKPNIAIETKYHKGQEVMLRLSDKKCLITGVYTWPSLRYGIEYLDAHDHIVYTQVEEFELKSIEE